MYSREARYQRDLDKAYKEHHASFSRLPRKYNLNTTSGIILTTLLLAAVITAAAQEVEADLGAGAGNAQLSETGSHKQKAEDNLVGLAIETCNNGVCTQRSTNTKSIPATPQFNLRRRVSIDEKLLAKLGTEQSNQVKFQVIQLLQKLYQSSEAMKRHFDYALATGCKFLITDSDASNWLTYQYQPSKHHIKIPMLPQGMRSIAKLYPEIDEYDYYFQKALLHELQHSRWTIINSDKNCDTYASYVARLLSGGGKAPSLGYPSDAKELMQRITTVQDYLLNHVANILPASFIDYTKKYAKHPRLFKMRTDVNQDDEEVAKELAHLQIILKDYQPSRYSTTVTKPMFDQITASIKNGKLSLMQTDNSRLLIYVDHVFMINDECHARGYLVQNPNDKVRALVMDTKFNKENMPKLYAHDFAESKYPLEHKVAEMEAHTIEIGLEAYRKIYTLAAQFTEQKQRESACQPKI